MTAPEWLAYIPAAKSALDIVKGILSELPQGPKRDQAQQQIEKAEAALRLSNAEIAKKLDYHLCKCTFPPQIMLWRADERVHVCPACEYRFPPAQRPDDYVDEFISVRS